MGRFVFQAEKQGSLIRGQDCARLTLTSAALRKLAKSESPLLPDISVETIPDKSKANAFAKFLVCVQATSFVAQTIGRMATAHPISLLEINTVLYAFCCLLKYLSWWDEPLDIKMPHIIYCSSNHAIGVCAWMKVKDTMDGFLEAFKADRDISVTNYVIGWHDFDDRSEIRDCIRRCRATNKQAGRPRRILPINDCTEWTRSQIRSDGPPSLKLYPGQSVQGFTIYDCSELIDTNTYAIMTANQLEQLKLARDLRLEDCITHKWDFGSYWLDEKNPEKMLTQGMSIARLQTHDYALE
ncbi:hypothetical protein HBI12_213860 [Parastagonospora nodorum]|nr:hypothetical protein HBI12_213860 [Parastagonospora nodorum]KAH5397908.1 hypothetical protein HBI47_209530 [Parastagonospora nodorum]